MSQIFGDVNGAPPAGITCQRGIPQAGELTPAKPCGKPGVGIATLELGGAWYRAEFEFVICSECLRMYSRVNIVENFEPFNEKKESR